MLLFSLFSKFVQNLSRTRAQFFVRHHNFLHTRSCMTVSLYISFIFSSMFMKFRFRELRKRVGNCLSSFYWAQTLLQPTEQLSRSVCARSSPCICIWNAPCGMGLVHDKAVNWLFSCARNPQKAVSFRHTRPACRNTSRVASWQSGLSNQFANEYYDIRCDGNHPLFIHYRFNNCEKFSLIAFTIIYEK